MYLWSLVVSFWLVFSFVLGIIFWRFGQTSCVLSSTNHTRTWYCGWSMCSTVDYDCHDTTMFWDKGGTSLKNIFNEIHFRMIRCLIVLVPVYFAFTEFISTSNSNLSECLHLGFHHSSWWIFSLQNWMGWIWSPEWVISLFFLLPVSLVFVKNIFLKVNV